ncbi:MAG: hypothetical protein JWQ96_539 [Segetibacter sp.]|nr:hypothetical protein [Segetibacter sp.]
MKSFFVVLVFSLGVMPLCSFYTDGNKVDKTFSFPYKKARLTEREAAAHLLSRFTYGPTPEEIDVVLKVGLEAWFVEQLNAGLKDETLNSMLSNYDALNLSNAEVLKIFPKVAQLRKMAIKDGVMDKDSIDVEKKEYRDELKDYMHQNGYKPQQELFRQLINQKILRATYTNNQLQEVLTDFWFNHFNVSITKNQSAEFIPAYERDVIRPNVFGKFETILLATAKSPAMLTYLDNFSSAGVTGDIEMMGNPQARKRLMAQMESRMGDSAKKVLNKVQQAKKNQGLNENYAREVMELHTLGVDGGYTQQDVTQAARVLTGWTMYPIHDYGGVGAMKKVVDKIGEDGLTKRGFVHEGDFLFAANRHDTKEKVVLGKKFAAGGGYEEGVKLLKMLAHHKATAQFISKKIAVRFVNDNPPQRLVDEMAKTFTEKDGDIRQVLITMATSPEFWSKEAIREKTKSPFELVISSVRAVNAEIKQPYQLFNWVNRMGQKMYFYQAPTGFPDKGQYWINTGALLNRMNFGLALASQRITGVKINLAGLNNNREPESAEHALEVYSKIIMPERKLGETIKRLSPMLNEPDLVKKIDEAANKATVSQQQMNMVDEDAVMMDEMQGKGKKENGSEKENSGKKGNKQMDFAAMQTSTGNNSMLAQVVGIIIGSPEFQRR